MAEKSQRSNTKTATTLMAYAQLEVDNSSTCIPRLCKFNIVRIVLNRLIDGGDSNAIVVAVKIQSNKRTFRCCEIPLQQDGTLDAPVNLQYIITYPHYFKRDINKIQIYVQRRKNRPLIGYKTLATGEINLNHVIQHPTNLDLQFYSNTKQSIRQDELTNQENQKRSVGYVSIISLSSTIPDESNGDLTTNTLTVKTNQSFNDDDEYLEEELNSELEDSDLEFSNKIKQKLNRNLFRNKFIQIFKRKNLSTTNSSKTSTHNRMSHQTHLERQSDIEEEEEDPPSDISDDTIPVDQWSIESVPKPGFTPVEHLKTLHINDDDRYPMKKLDSTESPIESDTSDGVLESHRTQTNHENAIKQCDELYSNDHLPESIIFLYTGLNQSNINSTKFQEYNISVISIHSLNETKCLLNNIIQRIPKYTSQSVIRLVLLGDDAFVNSFLQSYVECLASKPHEYMSYFRFYFLPLVFSYLAKFLGSFDAQYEALFGPIDSSNEIFDVKDLVQKMTKYLKISQRTLLLPVGEVMLNRKGTLSEDDSSPTFLPFFCYVRLGTLSSLNENQFSSLDDNALLSASLSISMSTRDNKDSSDDENSQSLLLSSSSSNSPQSKLIKTSNFDESLTSVGDVAVDYWTILDGQKEKKDGIRTIKSSLKSNIRVLTITRQPTMNSEGKIASSLKMTFVTREKKLKMMKFGKKLKDLQNTKYLEPQAITGINRLVCTSKSQNVGLKVNVDGQEWDNVKFFQISSQWHTHIKYFPIAVFNDIRS